MLVAQCYQTVYPKTVVIDMCIVMLYIFFNTIKKYWFVEQFFSQ